MAKKINAQGNNARDDTPIRRAAQKIAAARTKVKRVTRSSGLLVPVTANEQPAHGDNAEPDTESGNISDVATTVKTSIGRSSKVAFGKGVSSDSEAIRTKTLGEKAARASRGRRASQAASSDGDEVPAATKKAKTRPLKTKTVRDKAELSDEGDSSNVLRGELASRKLKGGNVDKKDDGSSDKVRELERKLKNAEEKNRILAKGSEKTNSLKMIPKPKGSIGQKGYSLIEHMRLDPEDEEQKSLYSNILASVRALAHTAGIDFDMTYSEQPTVRLANIFLAAREKEPYLKRFSDDWATGEILRQFINGKRKGENTKAKQSEAEGSGSTKKRKGASAHASGSNKRTKNGRNAGRKSDSDEEV